MNKEKTKTNTPETKDQGGAKDSLTIDAQGQKVGRIATQAASHLLNKQSTSFAKNVVADVSVTVINASKLSIDPKKLVQKKYSRYTGYPGGLRQPRMEQVIDKHGHEEIIRKAVYGMLPGNKLRALRMKNLTITA